MRLLLSCLAVCLASTFGQTPTGKSGAPPTNSGATKPPGTPSIAPALSINPAKVTNPRGAQSLAPPRASPPNNRGLGIFKAPVSSSWGIPPPQQQWGRPQSYQPPNMSPGYPQTSGWGPQTSGWGPQPQPNPFQTMPWLRMQNMNVLLDRMDVPCGMSRRRQQMFMHAVDHPDPFCECRIGGCDGFMDFTGQRECGAFAASCCCTGTPYSSLITATLLSSGAGAQGQGPFNPYANPMMQPNPYQRGMQPPGLGGRMQQPQGLGGRMQQPHGLGGRMQQPQGLGGRMQQPQSFAPSPVPSPMRMSQAHRTQPSTVQDFRTMWFR